MIQITSFDQLRKIIADNKSPRVLKCSTQIFDEILSLYGQRTPSSLEQGSINRRLQFDRTIIAETRGFSPEQMAFEDCEKQELESTEPDFDQLRQLLNYASKNLEKFALTSVDISMTVGDVKFNVKITK